MLNYVKMFLRQVEANIKGIMEINKPAAHASGADPPQSNKNPCSVTALLCGNFGSLVDFAELKKKSSCFVAKFPQSFTLVFFCC